MNVIFLDIDGVLNCAEFRREKLRSRDFSVNMEAHCIARLKTIVQAVGASIVLISSWRKYWMRGGSVDSAGQRIETALAQFGLSVYDKTPVLPDGSRSQEVEQWLADNRCVDQFVILDDNDFGWSGRLRAHWVHCDDATGLTDSQAELAVSVLQGALLPMPEDKPEAGNGGILHTLRSFFVRKPRQR